MDAVVLAAGGSARFGMNKLLYRLKGKPVYCRILELLSRQKEAGLLEHVIVVSRYREILDHAARGGMEAVENAHPELGISHSLQLGLGRLLQLSPSSEGCLFAVADQPWLSEETLLRLQKLWRSREGGIAAVSCGGKAGNPVIFDSGYYRELMALEGDDGGRQVLRRHLEDVLFCPVPPKELADLDRPNCALLEENLPFLLEKGHTVSLVGAGGKTTLMYAMARCCAARGWRAIVTTSTHIRRPSEYPVAGSREELLRLLRESSIVVAGVPAPEGKLSALSEPEICEAGRRADVVFVEADGARGFPCKAPRQQEPVIPSGSDIVVAVLGLEALGRPLKEVCFCREQVMELLQTDENHLMTAADFAKILSSERGTRKHVGDRPYYVVLNQCDSEARREQAEQIEELLLKEGIRHVMSISLAAFEAPETGKKQKPSAPPWKTHSRSNPDGTDRSGQKAPGSACTRSSF